MRQGLFKTVALALLAGLLLLGISAVALQAVRPNGGIEILLPTAETATIKVYVTGAVNNEGVYTLPPTARVEDAVQAAGGLTASADRVQTNLAAKVLDGDHLHIAAIGTPAPASAGSPASAAAGQLLNLNSATAEQLSALPGIGAVKAQAIISYRTSHGRFTKVEDLLAVSGIGPATLEQLRPYVTAR